MEDAAKTVTIKPSQTFTLPDALCNSLLAPSFIGNLPLPAGAGYSSAALVGNHSSQDNVMGMIAWTAQSNWVQVAPASLGTYTAVCGVAGGLVALAKADGTGLRIELRNSPLIDTNWGVAGNIVFNGVTGTIQAMAQQGNVLYGFIKGGPKNAFFTVQPQNGATPLVYYYQDSEAAAAFFPVPSDNWPLNVPTPIAFHNGHMYAIGESHANVLYAVLAVGETQSLPIPKSDTWGLHVDDSINRAYGVYDALKRGDIMPYDIRGDGTLDRTGYDTITSFAGVGLAIDTTLHLLYVSAAWNGGLQVYDTVTNQRVTPSTLDSSLTQAIGGGVWADSANGLLVAAGVSESISRMGIYTVTVE